MSRHDLSTTTVAQLLADGEVVAIVERYRPGLTGSQDVASVAGLPVNEALKLAERYAKPGEIEQWRAEVEAL